MVASKFLNKTVPLCIADIYPNTLILLIYDNKRVDLLDTNKPKFTTTFNDLESYMRWYKAIGGGIKYHFLNFEDISYTKIGRSLRFSYVGLQSIHILEASKELVGF